jgi:hypothetical protein
VPEIIDPAVAAMSPNLYEAAKKSGLTNVSASQLNQMARQYEKGKALVLLGDTKGRQEFLSLDPILQENIRFFFPDREMFNKEKSYLRQVLEATRTGILAPFKFGLTPITKTLDALLAWEKTTKTPYSSGRAAGEAAEAQKQNLPVTKRADFSKGVLQDIYDGKNLWQWEKIDGFEQQYGVALVTLARGIAEGRNVESSIELYGTADEEIMDAIAFMYDEPEKFEEIKEAIKVDAQISPGRDLVNDIMFQGTKVDGNHWTNKALGIVGMDLSTRKGLTKAKRLVSGYVDGFYTIFGDPLTYIGAGLPSIAKLTAKGVGGIRVGLREAIKMSAFKTKGQRLAAQFQFVSERKGVESGYAWLFKEVPEVRKLWDDQLGPRIESYAKASLGVREATSNAEKVSFATKKSAVLESIRFDFPEFYNEKTIDTLSKRLQTFDAAGAQQYFTHIDDSYMLLNGTVNGISFRRNGIPFARKTRVFTSAMHRVAYSVFNPSSEIDSITKEIVSKTEGQVGAIYATLNKVADTENRLLNPDIDDIFKIQEDIAVARRMAYSLGVKATRVPGAIYLGPDSLVTADNIRNTANLVLPKHVANPITVMLLDETVDVQLTVLRNMHYAFMKRLGLEQVDIDRILEKTYNGLAGFTTVPDLPISPLFASQMHPSAVNTIEGASTLAATGAINPSQLTKAIGKLPFDEIYQLAARAKVQNITRATGSRAVIQGMNGILRSTFAYRYGNFWSGFTLFPRLGIRTNVDEGFFYYLTKPTVDIMNLVMSKFKRSSKGVAAVTGSSGAIGPWKGSAYYMATKFGITINGRPFDPRKILSSSDRAELSEGIRAGLSKELGYEVPLSEVAPLVIKDAILSRVKEVLDVNDVEWQNWEKIFRHNSNFTESLVSSMGARDLIVGRMDRDAFDASFSVDAFNLFLKEMGLDKSSRFTPREIAKLDQRDIGVTMWDNFLIRFGFNQVKILENTYINPVNVFYDNNGLRTNLDFAKGRTDLMEQMGASYNEVTGVYDELSTVKLRAALSNHGETVYFRQQGLSDSEIARIYSERMLTDMRYAFHGSSEGFNDNLYNLMAEKHKEVVKVGTRQGKPQATAWSRAATNLTWKEFDDATIGFRPTSGYINTRIKSSGRKKDDYGPLVEDLGTLEKMFEKYPDKVMEIMDRQVTGFLRLPAMKVAVDKGFVDMKPYEALLVARHKKAIKENNPSLSDADVQLQAELIAEKTITNNVINMATNTVLEFVDNPNIRSNFALSVRYVGRFIRATEDFQRRVYRMYSNEAPRAIFRMRLVNYGLENFGGIYEDENGEEYWTFPTDIVTNTVVEKTMRFLTGNEGFKIGEYNNFSFKWRLSNPSFAPDAGAPSLAGPIAAISVLFAKAFLRELPKVSAVLPKDWEDEIYPWTNKAADYLDRWAMGHIGRNTDLGDILRFAAPMLFSTVIDTFKSTEDSTVKSNYAMQAICYREAFGNGIPDNPTPEQKVDYLDSIKSDAGNIAWAQSIIGLQSPAYPQLKDGKGLPEFIKENGISTWTSAFWDIYNGILQSDVEVANPFELAMATFIGKYPGKACYTIPRNEKAVKVFISKTDELKEWATKNKRFLETYDESGIGYIFAPKIGEYNPDIYQWMESQGLVVKPELKKFLRKVQTATDKIKYFAIETALLEKLENTADYTERSQLISAAAREKELLRISNPLLESEVTNPDRDKGIMNEMLKDVGAAVADPTTPMSKETRIAMQVAVQEMRAFIEFSDNSAYQATYSFTTDRKNYKENVMNILRQLAFDPAVREATRLIFVPLLNQHSRDALSASVGRK